MRYLFKSLTLVLVLAAVPLPRCFGQASAINGEINGTVTDPSGAAVAGATVSATNPDRGFKHPDKTGDTGLYRFGLLPLGTYEVEVQAAGCAAAKRTGIVLTAGYIATLNVA